jgi:hypothetical protein
MTDDMTIRVHADDLAGLIRSGSDARADLETCIRDATEAAAQWQDGMNELLEQFNRFRRAVQEATGLDQPELLHDDELITRIRTAAGQPYATFSIDGWTGTAQKLSPDAERRLQSLPTVSVEFEGTYEAGGPPVKQDVDPAWLDTAQQRVGEQLAADRELQWEAGQEQKDPPSTHREDAITYAKMIEREKATLADGSQVRFYSDERPDDGPPTESMPPVEQPPTVPDVFAIGRVFTRGDSFPAEVEGWWGITTRSGDIWELLKFVEGMAVFYCGPLDLTRTWDELLHMHGTAWELVMVDQARAFNWIETWRALAGQPSVAEQALVDDEAAHDE